jgi:MFS family permease
MKGILSSNKVIWLLTFSDIFTWGAYFVINVISGIYLAGKLGVDTIEIVGIGTTIYFFSRALFQLPVGMLLDRVTHDRDEIAVLAGGCVLMGLSFIFYPAIASPWVYFFLQLVFGLGTAMNLNAWRKLFATNLDANREGREYGTYEVLFSGAIAAFSWLAGLIANINRNYFDIVIVVVGFVMMFGAVWSLLITRVGGRKSI